MRETEKEWRDGNKRKSKARMNVHIFPAAPARRVLRQRRLEHHVVAIRTRKNAPHQRRQIGRRSLAPPVPAPKASAGRDGTSVACGDRLHGGDRSWAPSQQPRRQALALFVLCVKRLLVARCICLAGSGAMIIVE